MTFLRRRSETENEEKIWRRKIFFSPRRREMEKEKEDDILSRKIILFWRRRTEKETSILFRKLPFTSYLENQV